MGRVIVVTSGKGGVGKTTVTANLGSALALMGRKVLVIDMDIGLRNLDVVLGVENRVVYDIVDVLEGKCRLKQAFVRDKRIDGLMMLPASQTRDKSDISETQMIELLDELKKIFDFILLDCPAGIEQGFRNSIAGAEEAIIVTMPEVSAVRDADRVAGLLAGNGIAPPWLVINRLRKNLVRKGDMLDVSDTTEILGLKLLGVVPDDEMVVRSTNMGEPTVINNDSAAAKAFKEMSLRLLGEETEAQRQGLVGAIMRFLGLENKAI